MAAFYEKHNPFRKHNPFDRDWWKWAVGAGALFGIGYAIYQETAKPAQAATAPPGQAPPPAAAQLPAQIDVTTPVTDPYGIAVVQGALSYLAQARPGTFKGGFPVDGNLQNPQFVAALTAFQKTEGLPATGVADYRTMAQLVGVATVASGQAMSTPAVSTAIASGFTSLLSQLSAAGWTPGITYPASDGVGPSFSQAVSQFQTKVNQIMRASLLPTTGVLDWSTLAFMIAAASGHVGT